MVMNSSQARAGVSPILSDHARGYSNADYIGSKLFPTVLMPTRAAKRIEFDRSSFRLPILNRAPGSDIAQTSFGYEGAPVQLRQRALRGVVPREHLQEAAAVPDIDLQQYSVDTVLAIIALGKEVDQAKVARNPAAYQEDNKLALAPGDRFSDDASDPHTVIGDAKEVIRRRTGRRPNLLAISATVASALKRHPAIREHFRPTGSSAVSDAMLASYFDLKEVVVGDAIYDEDANTTVDVWGDDAILAFVPPEGARRMALPSYGYTYQLGGHPFVEEAAWDNNKKSWCNDVTDEYAPELVGPDAGFLIRNAVDPID